MKRLLVWVFGVIALLIVGLLLSPLIDYFVESRWIHRLDAPDASVREEAIRRLDSMRSTRAITHLMKKLVSAPTVEARRGVYPLFSALDGEFRTQTFVRALVGKNSARRSLAGDALTHLARDTVMDGSIGSALVERGVEAEPFLTHYLSSREDADSRAWAARVFINARPKTEEAVEALTEALADASSGVRKHSVMALGFVSEQRARPSIPQILKLLQDSDDTVRDPALWTLCKLGASGDETTLSALQSTEIIEILKRDPGSLKTETRKNAATLLTRIRMKKARPVPHNSLEDR